MSILDDFVERYGPKAGRDGPPRLIREVFGANPDSWQDDVLGDIGDPSERLVAVRSCHGPGKTTVAAWSTWAMLLARYPQKTVATAPTSGQLHGALVPEVHMWGNKLPPAIRGLYEFKNAGIYLKSDPKTSYFEARTARAEQPEALQGVHSDNVLLIGDEASGIPEPVFPAAAGSMSGHNATTLLIGNPVRTTGFFFDCFHANAHLWKTYKIGYADSPRVTDAFVDMIRHQYGEDSMEFRVRCLGEFPKADVDTLIPYHLIRSAQERDIEEPWDAPRVWGLDVARYGDDKVSLAERTPRTGRILGVWSKKDLMDTVGRVKSRWDDLPGYLRPSTILVDAVGMGGGVVDRLKELGLPAKAINVAETSALSERFGRARSELWWKTREWLSGMDVHLVPPKDSRDREDPQYMLAEELAAPKYKYASTGRIDVEPKSETKKTIRRSPDVADSLVLTFAVDLAKVKYGSKGRAGGEALKRGLPVV